LPGYTCIVIVFRALRARNTITKKITLQNYPKFKLNGVLYMAFTNLVKYRFVSPPKAKTNL
ncbi:MAG: hypothetical protein ACK53P_19330, partial [Pseudanabaena sp.]